MESELVPGTRIRIPASPEWGMGHVQSRIGHRLTANFEHQGKVTLDLRNIRVEVVQPA
ncbi:MAG: DUF3553 domain-containing protein [Geminicoccaceae bacterium]